MHPKDISISGYTYPLPDERIAAFPLAERDASKLLIYKKGNISQDIYKNIAAHIPANSLLVFNNTKVIQARIPFQKPTGGVIEIFCLEPDEAINGYSTVMNKKGSVKWKCMIGGAGKWKEGVLEKQISNNNIPAPPIIHFHFTLPCLFMIVLYPLIAPSGSKQKISIVPPVGF